MSNENGQLFLKEKDFVDAVDEEGNDLGYQVPKHWGADDLPPGVEKKKSSRGSGSKSSGSKSSSSGKDDGKPDGQEPAGNASTEDWVAYAKSKGADDADLLDDKGEPLTRDALRDKYAASGS